MPANLTLETIAARLQAIEREIHTSAVDQDMLFEDDDDDDCIDVLSERGRELLDALIREIDQVLIAQQLALRAL